MLQQKQNSNLSTQGRTGMGVPTVLLPANAMFLLHFTILKKY